MRRRKKGEVLSRYCLACGAPFKGPAGPVISHCARCCEDCAKLLRVKIRRLQKGEVLVKARGGLSRRARVVAVSVLWATLEALAPSVHARGRSEKVKRWTVAIGEDGLPEGYRRSPVEHDWQGTANRQVCRRVGCGAEKWPRGVGGDVRVRYRRWWQRRAFLKCPPCEGKP